MCSLPKTTLRDVYANTRFVVLEYYFIHDESRRRRRPPPPPPHPPPPVFRGKARGNVMKPEVARRQTSGTILFTFLPQMHNALVNGQFDTNHSALL